VVIWCGAAIAAPTIAAKGRTMRTPPDQSHLRQLSDPTAPPPSAVADAARGRRIGRVTALVRRFPLVSFFALAYGISWFCWLPYLLSTDGLGLEPGLTLPSLLGDSQLVGVLPGAYAGPLGSALIVTALTGGRAGLRRWRRRLLRWKVTWYWYAIVLLGVPALLVGGSLTLPGVLGDTHVPGLTIVVAYLPMLVLQMLTTGAAEEPGWRDYALPVLQRRRGPALGTLILGVVWAGWHLPLFFTAWSLAGRDPRTGHWWATVGAFVLMAVALSVLITWVFNHTRQSLPIALVLHASNNATASLILPTMFPQLSPSSTIVAGVVAYGAVAVLLLAATRGRLGYRPERDEDTVAGQAAQRAASSR
jgi:membrane protease YdiL (CAAX protease family)